MSGDDQREPLWASSLADQPRRDPVVAPDRPEAEPPPSPTATLWHWLLAAAVGVLAGLAVVAVASGGRGSFTVEEVPSSWGTVPMTCHTLRLDQDVGAVELFSCRAIGGGALPTGIYRSPSSQWTSDLTRRDAVVNSMVISPEGELAGVAAYR